LDSHHHFELAGWKEPKIVTRFYIIAILLLHMLNSYVYLGNQAFWHYVSKTSRNLLSPLDRLPLRVGRVASFSLAALMAGGAWLLYRSSAATVMEMSIILLALVGGGISGAFLFGILTRSGDARSVLIGIAATVAFTGYSALAQVGVVPRWFNAYYTSILGNLVMFTTCWLAARLLPVQPRDLTSLTVWTRRRGPAAATDETARLATDP